MIAVRTLAIAAGLTMAAIAAPVLPAHAANPTMTASSATVAVGGSIDVTVDQCDLTAPPDEFGDRTPQVLLLVGSGSAQQRAATGIWVATDTYRLTVPGWVDPDQPALIVGTCFRTDFGPGSGFHWTPTFEYPDLALDVTPAAAPVPFASFALDRSAAESGQLVAVEGSGCDPGGRVRAALTALDGYDPRDHPDPVVIEDVNADADGSFRADLLLSDRRSLYLDEDDQPPVVGSYRVSVGCFASPEVWYFAPGREAEPQAFEVTATNPTDSMANGWTSGNVDRRGLTGAGCTGGRRVAVHLVEHSTHGTTQVADAVVVPGTDGSWTYLWSDQGLPDRWRVVATADCGDPAADGFRYVARAANDTDPADLEVTGVQPDAAEAGSDLAAVVVGRCAGTIDAVLADDQGEVVASSSAIAGTGTENTYRFDLTAPPTPGGYRLLGRCDRTPGPAVEYVVTSVGLVAPPATPIPGSAGYTG